MKPMGALPPGYAAGPDGRLRIAGHDVEALAARAGDTPFFAYDFGMIAARIARLRDAMPVGLGIHYALKANPLPALAAAMRPLVDGFDVASGGELALALDASMSAGRISFAGPGKRDREIEVAVRAGATINLESEAEAARALATGGRLGVTPRLAVRVNPPFELKGSGMRMGGGARPFGVDSPRVPALVRLIVASGADYGGLHIYAGSQALDAEAIVEAQRATVALSREIAVASGAEPPLVNLGGGFGVPYFAGDAALDIARVGAALSREIEGEASRYATELGRWIVAEAGVYVTRIVDRKESGGRLFLVTDGGLHHQLAASGNFGTVVRRNYPVAIAGRFDAPPEEEASIVGCLCTPLDRLADEVALPRAGPGDLVAVFMAGAYGASASPSRFLGHGPAPELLLGIDED